jgi:hypothetical protein
MSPGSYSIDREPNLKTVTNWWEHFYNTAMVVEHQTLPFAQNTLPQRILAQQPSKGGYSDQPEEYT